MGLTRPKALRTPQLAILKTSEGLHLLSGTRVWVTMAMLGPLPRKDSLDLVLAMISMHSSSFYVPSPCPS